MFFITVGHVILLSWRGKSSSPRDGIPMLSIRRGGTEQQLTRAVLSGAADTGCSSFSQVLGWSGTCKPSWLLVLIPRAAVCWYAGRRAHGKIYFKTS